MSLPYPAREEIARLSARMLLEIKAVDFNAETPFTYASGLRGPTYVDCRRIVSFPRVRQTLLDFMAATVMRDAGFEAFDNIAGGETAGLGVIGKSCGAACSAVPRTWSEAFSLLQALSFRAFY